MAKTATAVDRASLVAAIEKAEAGGPLKNQNELFNVVAELYNATPGIPKAITFSVVGLRVVEWGLSIKTPKGKRGKAAGVPLSEEQKAAMQAGRGKRVPRAEKFAADPAIRAHFDDLRRRMGPDYHNLIDKAEQGSAKAAIKLKCLDCSAGQVNEIKFCQCAGDCPVWHIRPYKAKPGEVPSDNYGKRREREEPELVELAVA